jgi:Cd2+/Zn2+-exporting ATPase
MNKAMAAPQSTYLVGGICCSTEETVLRKRLDADMGPGVYRFNPLTGELAVPANIPGDRVVAAVRRAGFDARGKQEPAPEDSFWKRHSDAFFTVTAAVMTLAGALLEYTEMPLLVARGVMLGAVMLGGWRIALKAGRALLTRALDMNVLMTVAVAGALAIGRWTEGATVIVLFSVALMLENYSTSRTRRAVRSLLALSPQTSCVIRDGREIDTPAADVVPGEVLVIRPGERIPLDGVVIDGLSTVNEATITGESSPVPKEAGATAFAGSLNGRGVLRIRVTKRYQDTTLAHMVHLIEEAHHQRAPVQNFIDRFASVYTPAVLGIAVAVACLPTLVFQQPFVEWLYRALVLLVIACPCALVISTPVTLVSALTNAARLGILIKVGKHLETISSVRTVAFDKTGTLTEGKPSVTDVILLNSISRERVVQIAAAMEQRSEHHLASAVLAEAARTGIDHSAIAIQNFEAVPGFGVQATIAGETYYLGNHRFCEENGFCSPQVEEALKRFSREGKTAVILGCGREALSVLALRDATRTRGREAIERLRESGVRNIVMLSGDHEATAGRIANELAIEQTSASLLPEQKVTAVEKLKAQHGAIAMVGDGINDAPALAASSVGIAMGVAGSDAALETADVVLMSDDLSRLPHLFALSRATMRIVRQNIAVALSLKAVFLVLSIMGVSTLWMALLADDGAALAVILNGLRILSFRDKP